MRKMVSGVSEQVWHKPACTAPVGEQLRALFLNNLTAVTGVGSSPALATCETSHVLLEGVSGGFSRGFPCFRLTYYYLFVCVVLIEDLREDWTSPTELPL